MALVQRRMSRKKMFTLVIAILVIVVGGFWYLFLSGGTSISSEKNDVVLEKLRSELGSIQRVQQQLLPSLDKLYDDVRFQELKQFGDIPVEPGTTGRANPFLPF